MSAGLIVGRAAEWALLTRLLNRLLDGEGSSLLLLGAPGYGKSTLAHEVVTEAVRRGIPVRTGQSRPESRFLGYGLLIDAFGSQVLEPPQASGQPVRDHPRSSQSALVTDTLVEHVAALAGQNGLLVVMDDLHHADAASLSVLAHLLPRLSAHPVLWLFASRPPVPAATDRATGQHSPGWGPDTERDRLLATIRDVASLEPLADADVLAIAGHLLGGRPRQRLRAFLARAHGNPLHVTEMCRSLGGDGWVTRNGSDVDIPADTPLPQGFRELLTRAMDRLPSATARLLQLVAVLGVEAPVERVAEMAGFTPADVVRILRPAVAVGVVHHDGSVLQFRHELTRDAVYESLPVSARLAVHHSIGRRIVDHEGGEHLAWHHLLVKGRVDQAGDRTPREPDAVEAAISDDLVQLLGVGCSTGSAAPETVRDVLGATLAALPAHASVTPRLALQQAWAAMAAGEVCAGESASAVALGLTDDASVRTDALAARAESLTLQRRYAEAVAPLDEALAGIRDPDQRARLRVTRAYNLSMSGQLSTGVAELREIHATAPSASSRARAAAALAFGCTVEGHLRAALPLADEAMRVDGEDWGDPRNRITPHYVMGLILVNADRWDEAEAVILDGIRRCEDRGLLVDIPLYLSLRAQLLLMRGAWADAVTEAETGLDVSDSIGTQRNVTLLLDVVAFVAAHQGHRTAAADAIMRSERILPSAAVLFPPNRLVRTRTLFLDGPEQAAELLRSAFAIASAVDAGVQLVELGPPCVSGAIAVGDEAAARAVSRSVAGAAARIGTAYARGVAERCEGLVHQDAAALQRAVSQLRASPRVLDLADTLMDLARVAVGQRNRALARDAAGEALGTYREVGADTLAAGAAELLGDLGPARGSSAQVRGPARPSTGWASLTRTERTVAELVAEGLSNRDIAERLFVSHRTVETHVSHALTKLGVRSRVGLARAALASSPRVDVDA